MITKQQEKKTVTIKKSEYEALIHSVQVTKEFLQGKKETFHSSKELIKHLKKM